MHDARWGYLPNIARRHPETRIDSPSEPAVRLCRLRRWAAACAALAAATCVAAPTAVAGVSGSSGGAGNGSKGLVSARYQAIGCDTAAVAERSTRSTPSNAAVAADAALRSGIPATPRGFITRESGRTLLQYQFRNSIPRSLHAVSPTISTHNVPSAPESCRRIAASIASTSFEASIPSDGRRLFQIAVAFALAYVVFLTVWFWGTRERRSRVGRAARS